MTPAGCPLGGPCPAGAREGPAGRRRSAERSALHCVHAHCPLGLGHPSSQAGSGPLLGSLSRPLLVLTIHRQIHLPQWTGSPRRAGPRMSWALIGPQRHPAQGERRGEAQGRHLVNEGPPSPPPVLRILGSRNAWWDVLPSTTAPLPQTHCSQRCQISESQGSRRSWWYSPRGSAASPSGSE